MLFYFTMCMFIFNLHCQLVLCYINIRPNVKFPLYLKKAVLVSRNIAYLRKNQSTLCRILGLYSSLWMKDVYICVLCGCWFSILFSLLCPETIWNIRVGKPRLSVHFQEVVQLWYFFPDISLCEHFFAIEKKLNFLNKLIFPRTFCMLLQWFLAIK